MSRTRVFKYDVYYVHEENVRESWATLEMSGDVLTLSNTLAYEHLDFRVDVRAAVVFAAETRADNICQLRFADGGGISFTAAILRFRECVHINEAVSAVMRVRAPAGAAVAASSPAATAARASPAPSHATAPQSPHSAAGGSVAGTQSSASIPPSSDEAHFSQGCQGAVSALQTGAVHSKNYTCTSE